MSSIRASGRRRGGVPLLALCLLVAVVLVGCGTVTQPEGWAAPVVAENMLFVGDAEGHLYALDLTDLASPRRLWRYPIEGERDKGIDLKAIYATPVVADDTVYVGAYDGHLYAINATTGELRWRFRTEGPIIGGALVAGEKVYIGSSDGCLYALSDEGAAARADWRFCTKGSIWARPVRIGDALYIASMDGKLYAVDEATGQPRWAQPFAAEGAFPTTPVVQEGQLLIGALDKRLYAVDAASGQVAWSFMAENWFWTEPLVHEGMIYAGSLDGNLYAIDPQQIETDGRPRWRFRADAAIRSRPAVVGETVIVADREGRLYGVELATGTQRWTTAAAAAVLADLTVADERVFVSLQNGDLVSLDPASGAITQIPLGQ